MKKDFCRILRSYAFLLFVLTFWFFTSCSNLWKDESSENHNSEDKIAYIKIGSITKSGGNSEKFFSKRAAGSGTIFPDEADIKADLTNISLSGEWQSGSSQLLVPAPGSSPAYCANWTAFENAIPSTGLPIQTGSWTFTLQATYNGKTFSGSCPETIVSGSTKTLDFTLTAQGETKGGLSITVNITSGAATSVVATLSDSAGNTISGSTQTLTPASGKVTYSRSIDNSSQKLDPGLYNLTFEFKSVDSTANYSETLSALPLQVSVVAGITTTAEIDWGLNSVFTITYDDDEGSLAEGAVRQGKYSRKSGTITLPDMEKDGYYFDGWYINDDFSGNPITEIPADTNDAVTVHARFINTIYIKSTGSAYSATADGTREEYPLDTIESALEKIIELDSDEIDWNIELLDSLTGCQTIDMQSYYAHSITIKGKGGAKTINGNVSTDGGGSTLVVIATDDIPIILEDLIITGGKGTVANMSQWVGGGIYLQQGTLKLGDGVKITGNTVGTLTSSNESYGGGVYVNPDATLYIYGTACVGDPDISTAPTEAASGTELPSSTYANFAQCGAGIYSYGNVYLGYSSYTDEDNNTPEALTNGIIGNYGTFGGGIYVYAQDASSMGTVVMKSGKISYNFGCGVRTGKQSSYPSTFTMNGGEISYNKTKSESGGAGVENISSFVMNNGAISHNTAGKNCGGGVYNSGSFVMNDGEISYNTIDSTLTGTYAQCNGGGVYNYTGAFTMEGGTISHNSAPNGRGGGVCTYGYNSGGTNVFWMKGGVISENTAQYGGGGICNAGLLKLSGSPYIPAGDGDANDLAIVKHKDNKNTGVVFIEGTLTPPSEANGLVAKITPMEIDEGNQTWTWFTEGLIMFRGAGYEFYESSPEDGIPSSWNMSYVPEALCHFEMSSNVPEKYQNCVVSRNGFLKKGYNITSANYSSIISGLEDGAYYLNYQGLLNVDILEALSGAINDLADTKTIELDLFEATLTELDPFTGMTDTGNLITIVLPQSITAIGESAFFDCNYLSRVSIKSNITEIGAGAFSACNSLTYLILPDSVTSIGNGAFSGCESLWLSKLPNGITVLNEGVFQGSGMETLPYQDNPAITKIGKYAFEACSNLGGIDIGGVISEIEENAFKNAVSTEGWINIGPNLTLIKPGAFDLASFDSSMEVLFSRYNLNWTLTKDNAATIYLTPDYVDDPNTGTCWLSPYDDENPETSYYDVDHLLYKYRDYTWTRTE